MNMDSRLESAIKAGDVDAARIAIRAIADADVNRNVLQSLACADEAARALKSVGVALFEEDDGRFVMPPESEWSEALWAKIKGGLDWNFSRERLVHLQEITAWVHQKRIRNEPSFSNARRGRGMNLPGQSRAEGNKWVRYAILGTVAALAIGGIVVALLAKNR